MRHSQLIAGAVLAVMPALAVAGITTDTIGRVPEPETLALLAAGVIALVIAKRRK
ncbi:MAG TPA: PEP-CTERM sorting domain-containing protein [Casimicrobiaceae bacterium]|nr:PEP-CTERM sorting domain-containing protein [Casimicrobiaceae bacterium]